MKLETERLELLALNYKQFSLLINNIIELEKQLNCVYKAEPIEGIFKQILEEQLKATFNDKENYMWHSFWLVIRKTDRIVVGLIDFKNVPDDKGEVEIGYGLGKEFEHNGYITETVKKICEWAMNNPKVKNIIAETDIEGIASQKILKNCGFNKYKEEDTIWWKL